MTMSRAVIGAISVAVLCLVLLRIASADLIGLLRARDAPPSVDAPDKWRWAAAAPGMNIYLADSRTTADGRFAIAWANKRYFKNASGIDKSLIELMQFDCVRSSIRRSSALRGVRASLSRRFSVIADAKPDWTVVDPGTVDEQVLLIACGRIESRSLRRR